jgi:hypothetical protein
MLYWTAVFFIVALVAAVLGFGGIAGASAGIAKILFVGHWDREPGLRAACSHLSLPGGKSGVL